MDQARVGRRPIDVLAMGSLLAEQVIHVERHAAGGDQGSIPIRSMSSGTGGGAANVAAVAAWLGGRAAILSATGDGPRARMELARLARAGVDTRSVAGRPGHDADLLVLLCDPAGDWVALEQLDPALRMSLDDLGPEVPFVDATWFHVDGYAHHTAGSQAVVDAAVDRARVAGCRVSVDAAVPSTMSDPGYMRSLIGRADLAFVNDAEALVLTGAEHPDAALDQLLALGCSAVVLKRGALGSMVAVPDGRTIHAAVPTRVVDTIAAGDAYVAATLVALAGGASLADATMRGGAAGSLACRTPGSQGGSFSASDVDALLGIATATGRHGPKPVLAVDDPVPAYVLVPGSEGRARQLASSLNDPVTLAHDGDHLLIAGLLGAVPVAICSTGIGGLGVSRVVERLAARGATTFIRIGVTGAIPASIVTGDCVVASAAVRMDGTSDFYVDLAYPAVADHVVTAALVAGAQAVGAPVHVGIGATASSFYAGEGIPAFRGFRSATTGTIEAEMREAGVLDWDTETATLFVVARRLGCRAGRLNVVVDDRSTGRYDPIGEPRAIKAALAAVGILAEWDANGVSWAFGVPAG